MNYISRSNLLFGTAVLTSSLEQGRSVGCCYSVGPGPEYCKREADYFVPDNDSKFVYGNLDEPGYPWYCEAHLEQIIGAPTKDQEWFSPSDSSEL